MIFHRVPEAAQGDPTERLSEINALNSLPILLSPTRLPLTRPTWKPEGKATPQSVQPLGQTAGQIKKEWIWRAQNRQEWGRSEPLKNDIAWRYDINQLKSDPRWQTSWLPSNGPWPSEYVCVFVLSCIWLFEAPWTVACQPSPSMEFSRQKYWSELPFPSLGDLAHTGINLSPLCLRGWMKPISCKQETRNMEKICTWRAPQGPAQFQSRDYYCRLRVLLGLPWWLGGKESTCNSGVVGSIPGWGRSPGEWQPTPVFLPGEFHGQRAWQATVLGVTKTWTWLKRLSVHSLWGFP